MTLSFQKRLILGVLLLVLSITAALAFVGVQFGSAFLRSRFDERMHFLARHLALNSELGLLLEDQGMLKKNADNILSENDVVSVWIEDANGKTILKAGSERIKDLSEAEVLVWQREQEEEQVFAHNPERNKLLGKVHVVYSTAGIDFLLIKFRNLHIMVGLGAGFIGFWVFFFFSRSLINPLKDLVKATKQVTTGDFKAKVKEGTIPEIQHLAHAFNNMLTALELKREKLNEVHRQVTEQKALAEVGLFSFTVAHEVKNPLGIIKGALDVLKKPEVNQATKATMISYIEEEIMRLDRLVQDFLSFARPQKINFQQVNLTELVEGIVERGRLEWGDKGVRLHYTAAGPECILRADEDQLSRAILNILQNACQACGDQGDVFVTVNITEASGLLEISDTGKGMPPEVKEKALEPFFTTKATGTGLGLAFVNRVMRSHDSWISISDNQYGGTSIQLEFKRLAGGTTK